ncbi:unnamed protein product, partial [Rotaria sp. Silwood1]
MFSLRFVLLLLFILHTNGRIISTKTLNSTNLENNDSVDKVSVIEEEQNEELISSPETEKSQLIQVKLTDVQRLLSPCIGAYPSKKLAYSKDKTKYIQCRDEFHYEIVSCLNGGEYNAETNSCDLIITMINKCEEEKPCLNNGHCIARLNSTFKCICHPDWTGDRCEIPINSCVKEPCGPNASCRTLKTIDYEQDYVCICHQSESYGLNCQEVVPNPCLTSNEQFFPYAFSQRAYIHCDGEIINFQPCSALLYWNQEEKNCNRKRPTKVILPKLKKKLSSKSKKNKQEEKIIENINQEIITTTVQIEQKKKEEKNYDSSTFIPTSIVNTEQSQSNMNTQQIPLTQNVPEIKQKTSDLSEPLLQSVDSKHIHQDLQPENTTPLTIQSEQNESLSQTNLPQSNLTFTTEQWLHQIPETTTQNDEPIFPQSGQDSYTTQDQSQFEDQNQQVFVETTTQHNEPSLPQTTQ